MARLVVFELHHLGDAVMALPFLRGAQREFSVTVVARTPVAEFLRAAMGNVAILDAPDSWLARVRLARSLHLSQSDAAACVWADARAHILMALTGAGRRIGFPMTPVNYYAAELPWRRRRLLAGKLMAGVAGLFHPPLTQPLTRLSHDQHHMEDWNQIAGALSIGSEVATPWVDLPASRPRDIAEFLRHQQGNTIVLIHPGGRQAEKRWSHFPVLLGRLADQDNVAAIIVQPPGEPAPAPVGPRQQTFRADSWSGLFAIFSAADAVVCNDSFAAHLAAAMGKPVVTLFGSGNPDWFSPWSNRHLVVVPEGRTLYPLIDHGAPPGSVHLDSIPVDLVESRLRTALNAG